MNRSHFGRQPVRIILVDLSSPFDLDICHNLQFSLQNVLSVACSLNGPSRVPFFGLYALGAYPEALLPLQPTRGNFYRIQNALQELQAICNELSGTSLSGCVVQGLEEALQAFKRQSQNLQQTAGYFCQLELTLFTCQAPLVISRQVEKVTKSITMENVKKVQVVCINHPDRLRMNFDDLPATQDCESSGSSSNNDLNAGLSECTTVDADTLSLENYVKSWLHDSGTDREHLHIMLHQDQDQSIVLKCDFKEKVLNTASLPFPGSFSLHPEIAVTKPVTTGAKSTGQNVSITQLRAVKRIPQDSVCESVNFGVPLVVRATSCWKMEWEELETNHNDFLALCHLLHERNQVLLLQLYNEAINSRKASSAFRYQLTALPPCGFFMLFPSSKDALLLKPVASRELMLPDESTEVQAPAQEHVMRIEGAMDALECADLHNPLTYDSSLYPALCANLTKGNKSLPNSAAGGPPNKSRKFAPSNNSVKVGRANQAVAPRQTPSHITNSKSFQPSKTVDESIIEIDDNGMENLPEYQKTAGNQKKKLYCAYDDDVMEGLPDIPTVPTAANQKKKLFSANMSRGVSSGIGEGAGDGPSSGFQSALMAFPGRKQSDVNYRRRSLTNKTSGKDFYSHQSDPFPTNFE